MDYSERVAYHEAAHAVLAHRLGAQVLQQGIDITAPSSVEGAYGKAAVSVFAHEDTLDETEQRRAVVHSLAIICAGAASDAKILGRALPEALAQQPGDENVARNFLKSNPLIETPEELEGLLMAAADRFGSVAGPRLPSLNSPTGRSP
jgi:hypothetical protein